MTLRKGDHYERIKNFSSSSSFNAYYLLGVEPYAHHEMHPPVAPADFAFSDVKESVADVTALEGNATSGEALVTANCTACHSI